MRQLHISADSIIQEELLSVIAFISVYLAYHCMRHIGCSSNVSRHDEPRLTVSSSY